jgi:hypothetical protein
VDLVAEDEAGNPVTIENQLEKSDHDHLGKLLTYMTALEARTAIWIVAQPRQEHLGAVSWLNESTPANFYLIKVEAVRIGDSVPAPLLTVIVGPSEEAKEAGRTKKQLAESQIHRKRFWQELLEQPKAKTSLFKTVSPGAEYWLSMGAGRSGLTYAYWVRKHATSVELGIDRGKDRDDENVAIYEQLAEHTDAIEAGFGQPLEWERVQGKRVCRIRHTLEGAGYADEDRWPEIHDAMIDAMIRLKKAFRPHVEALSVVNV